MAMFPILVATLLRRRHPTTKVHSMTQGSTTFAHPAQENGSRLTTLDPSAGYVTNTYAVADPQVGARIREAAKLADGFTPIPYELRHSGGGPGRQTS